MTKNRLIFVATLLALLLACKGRTNNTATKPLPKNLNEAIAYLNADWSSIEKIKFKNQSEEDAGVSLHFTTGLWIRNNWVRSDRDTNLVNYFHKIGIYAPDDISSIIIISFHRQLNHQPLDIEGQIKPIKLYWKSVYDCEEEAKKMAMVNYNKFGIGSPITILMVVDTSDQQRNATVYECPNPDWIFNPKKDLMIKGTVTGKYFLNDSANVFFKVKINSMNYLHTAIISDTVKIGNIEDFSLKHLVVK